MAEDFRALFEGVSTATVSMQLLKRGIRSITMQGVKALNPKAGRVVGPAFTVRYVPYREDLCRPENSGRPDSPPRLAIETAPSGSVMVVDARGQAETAVLGDILGLRLKLRGVAGVVTDGAVRDSEAVIALDYPIFCAGATPPASFAGLAAADIETPIGCGGVAVLPGDVIMGDVDGVVVVPRALAHEVARDGAEQERLERFIAREVAHGRSIAGLYPPDDTARADYRKWLDAGEPDD